jgi:hypothetical protein
MRVYWLFGVFLVLFLIILFSGTASAKMTCRVIQDPGMCNFNEVVVLRMKNYTNSHVEYPSVSNYGWKLCCSDDGPIQLGADCTEPTAVTLMRMYNRSPGYTNAHVEKIDEGNYPWPVCLSLPGGTVKCEYGDAVGINGFDECTNMGYDTCVGGLYRSTSSHLANCDETSYRWKICCNSSWIDSEPPDLFFVDPTPPDNSIVYEDWFYINVTADEVLDTCIINVDGAPAGTTYNTRNCYINMTSMSDGPHDFYAWGNDSAGNPNQTETRTVIIATDLPNTVIEFPEDGSAHNESNWTSGIYGQAYDEGGGVNEVKVNIKRMSDSRCYLGSDWGSCPNWINAFVNNIGGTPTDWSLIWSPAIDNVFNITAKAIDTDSFEEPYPPSSITMYDTNPPSTTMNKFGINPPAGSFHYIGIAGDPEVNGSVAGVAVVLYMVVQTVGGTFISGWIEADYIDPDIPVNQTIRFEFTPAFGDTGRYTIFVKAIDAAGNEGPLDTDTISYDKDAPTVDIQCPETGIHNQTSWTVCNPVSGVANDDLAVMIVDIMINRSLDGKCWNNNSDLWVDCPYWINGTTTTAWSNWEWPQISNYVPPIGEYWIWARAQDYEGKFGWDSELVYFDNIAPTVKLDDLPEYTNKDYITVKWTANDDESGIMMVDVEWRPWYAGGWQLPDWQKMGGSPYTDPIGEATIGGLTDMWTYVFRATAWDNAWNQNFSNLVNTTVNLHEPICQIGIEPLNQDWTREPFNITMAISGIETGIDNLEVQWMQDGIQDNWININKIGYCNLYTNSSTFTTCNGPFTNGDNHHFRCRVKNTLGTQGSWDQINVGIDSKAPTGEQIIEPSSKWTNSKKFPLKWSVIDPPDGSGIECQYVQWRRNQTLWYYIESGGNTCLPTSLTSINFGDASYGEPGDLDDAQNLSFMVMGTDIAGNIGAWSEIVNTTIDTISPEIDVVIYDQLGNLVVSPGHPGIISLDITSTATDNISGIGSHILFVQKTISGNIVIEKTFCNGDNSCYDFTLTAGADPIVIWSEAIDNAGNKAISNKTMITEHPIANFIKKDIVLTIGSSEIVGIQVRNLEGEDLDTTLTLEGYPLAGFIADSWTGNFVPGKDLQISGTGENIATFYDFPAGGEGIIYVQIFSTGPMASPEELILKAVNGYGNQDGDSLTISTVYPASFDALTEGALTILVALAGLCYFFVRRK